MGKPNIVPLLLVSLLLVNQAVGTINHHQNFLSLRAQAQLDTEQGTLYPAVSNVYNIFTGNPLSPADPGFSTVEAFALNWGTATTSDARFKLPAEFYVRDFLDCNAAASSEAISGMQSYQKSLQQSCKIEGGYNAVVASASFQANVDYKQRDEGQQKQETVSTMRKTSCRTYIVALNDNIPRKISPALSNLFKKYHDAKNWEEFINKYGTHYCKKAIYGASVIEETSISKTDAESLSSKGLDVGVSLEVKTPTFNVGASSQTSLSSEQRSALNSVKTKSSTWVLGLGPDANRPGDFAAWVDKVQQGKLVAQPVDYTLGSLEDLFDTDYWPKDANKKEIAAMKVGFVAAFTKIAKSFPNVRADVKLNADSSNKIGDGYYSIRNKLSNLLINAYDGRTGQNIPYMQFTVTNNPDQIFLFESIGTDTFRIKAKHSNLCLDVFGANTDNNAPLVQFNCHGGMSQQWKLQYNNDGSVTIMNMNSKKVLDIMDGSTKTQVGIVQYQSHGGENQRWYLKRI